MNDLANEMIEQISKEFIEKQEEDLKSKGYEFVGTMEVKGKKDFVQSAYLGTLMQEKTINNVTGKESMKIICKEKTENSVHLSVWHKE